MAFTYSWSIINTSQTVHDAPVDQTLMDSIREDLTYLREWLGMSYYAGAVPDHDHDGVNSKPVNVTAGQVGQSELKSTPASATIIVPASGSFSANLTMPGGEYSFYPQSGNDAGVGSGNMSVSILSGLSVGIGLSYATKIFISGNETTGLGSMNIGYKNRYVTASGEIHWTFILRNKVSKATLALWEAPDHPSMGNGGNPDAVPHPFGDYDPLSHEIIVIQSPQAEDGLYPAWLEEAKAKAKAEGRSAAAIIVDEYEVDESSNPVWDSRPVTVGLDHDCPRAGDKVKTVKKAVSKGALLIHKTLKKKGGQA